MLLAESKAMYGRKIIYNRKQLISTNQCTIAKILTKTVRRFCDVRENSLTDTDSFPEIILGMPCPK